MSQFDIRVPQSVDVETQPMTAAADDEPPARRLLAHDMEPMVWEDDGERPLPPPD